MTVLRGEFEGVKQWRLSVPKGRVIYDEGEAATSYYRVESGCIRLQVNREDGRRQILVFLLPGDTFGVEGDGLRHVAAEAVARTDLTCFQASTATGTALGADASARIALAACELAAALSTHIMGLCHTSAEDRVRWFLGWMAARQGVGSTGGRLELPMSRRDIADFLGLTAETLSRTFGRLEALGAIEVKSARRLILRPRAPRPSRSDGDGLRAA